MRFKVKIFAALDLGHASKRAPRISKVHNKSMTPQEVMPRLVILGAVLLGMGGELHEPILPPFSYSSTTLGITSLEEDHLKGLCHPSVISCTIGIQTADSGKASCAPYCSSCGLAGVFRSDSISKELDSTTSSSSTSSCTSTTSVSSIILR